jgi:hypothetical protein
MSGALAAVYGVVVVVFCFWARSMPLATTGALASVAVVIFWWVSIPPSNDRDWLADVANPATASIDGDRVTFRNVRNFHYRSETDYDENWEERTYDLSRLRGGDMFLSYWGSPWIAHTIVSWDFDDGQHLAVSIETRKEVGEEYSAVLGFFRQFELYYVVSDERDVVGLRTNHRGEDVYLYRLRTPVDVARSLLLDYIEEINRIAATPEWYNAATHNCTTAIFQHMQRISAARRFDWRILVNGRIDQLGYERGTIDTSLPFEEMRAKSDITERAKAAGASLDFSQKIRVGLPGERH